MTPKKFLSLKKTLESLKSSKSKSLGALESLQSSLKENHNCKDLKEAKEKIIKLKAHLRKEQEIQEKELDQLYSEFGDKL